MNENNPGRAVRSARGHREDVRRLKDARYPQTVKTDGRPWEGAARRSWRGPTRVSSATFVRPDFSTKFVVWNECTDERATNWPDVTQMRHVGGAKSPHVYGSTFVQNQLVQLLRQQSDAEREVIESERWPHSIHWPIRAECTDAVHQYCRQATRSSQPLVGNGLPSFWFRSVWGEPETSRSHRRALLGRRRTDVSTANFAANLQPLCQVSPRSGDTVRVARNRTMAILACTAKRSAQSPRIFGRMHGSARR